MLAKKPSDRYQTPAEVAAALGPFLPATGVPVAAVVAGPDRGRGFCLPSKPQRLRIVLALAVLLVAGLGLTALRHGTSPSPTSSPPALPMRNRALRELRDNSWVRVGPFQGRDRDSREVPMCYDPDLRRFIRIGGRGSVHSNEISSFDLGTGEWKIILPFATDPADRNRPLTHRPSYGSHRGICYDRDNKCIWEICQAEPPFGIGGLWQGKGPLTADHWTPIKEVPHLGVPRVAYDEHARKVVYIGLTTSSWGVCGTYDPLTRQVVPGDADPSGAKTGRVGLGHFYGFLYVPELKGCLLVGRTPDKFRTEGGPGMVTWRYDAASGKWTDLAPPGPRPAARYGMGLSYDRKNRMVLLFGGVSATPMPEVLDDTWSYDPVRNIWTEIRSESSPQHYYSARPVPPADCQMMAYDEEHNVHVLVLQDWVKDSAVWAYRYKR
jgi:hypothetical protein